MGDRNRQGRLAIYLQALPDSGGAETALLGLRVTIILWTILVAEAAILVASSWPIDARTLAFSVAYCAVAIGLLFVLRLGWIRVAAVCVTLASWTLLTIEAAQTGGVSSPDYALCFSVIIGAAVFLGAWAGIVMGSLTLIAGTVMFAASRGGWLTVGYAYTPAMAFLTYATAVVLIVILTAMAMRDVRSALTKARSEVEERRQAEKALREREARLEAFFAGTSTGIAIADTSGAYLRVNESYLEMFGCPGRDELQRTSLADRLHPDDAAAFLRALQRLRDGEAVSLRQERRFVRLDDTVFWGEVSVTPIKDESGPVSAFAAVITDVTARKQAEAQLRQAQKMEALGQLAGGIAHDFNNLLTVIRGHVALIEDDELPASMHASVKAIAEASDRASGLTRQLLAFGRQQVIHVHPVNLNTVVGNLMRLLQGTLGETIAVATDLEPMLPTVDADTGLVGQVVMNLCVNARDAMPSGGRLTISTGSRTFSASDLEGHAERRPGPFAYIEVTDTGAGMDDATVSQIFQPFFTTKAVGKGTGLGLAMVYGIVRQHRGWVDVSTRLGSGSSFRVYFPANEGTAAPAPAHQAPAPAAHVPSGHEVVLLAEDEPTVRDLLESQLRAAGYTVHSAANGPEALEIWARHASEIDILVSDIVMPEGLSGLELAAQLRSDKPGIAVLLMSGYSVELSSGGAVIVPDAEFLQKPFSPSDFTRTVRKALDR